MKKVFIVIMALCMALAGSAVAGPGEVLYEYWQGVPADAGNLGAILDQINPTNAWVLFGGIDGPVDILNNNSTERIRGWIIPPETANYTFKMSSDDDGELWLSTDEDPNNVQLVSHVEGWSGHNDFGNGNVKVDIADIPLEAGQKYYFHTMMREGGGGDNLSVGWISDGTVIGTDYTVVGKDYVWIPRSLAIMETVPLDGFVKYEHWDNISGGSVSDLTGNANYPDNPTGGWMLYDGIDGPTGRADNFGARITGMIIPPETANYTFLSCTDDNSELWLSTDSDPANVRRIAYNDGSAGHNNWGDGNNKTDETNIPLVAGQKYYFYQVMKEGGGGDNISVGWISDGAVIGSAWDGGNSVVAKEYVSATLYSASSRPAPEDGATGIVQLSDIELSWAPGYMPSPIEEYRVSLDSDTANVGTGGALFSAIWKEGDAPVVIPAGTLSQGVDYFWQVDAFGNPAAGLGDPNNKMGELWTFKTLRSYPVIITNPAGGSGWRDETVTLSVAATSGDEDNNGDLHYDWQDDAGSLGLPDAATVDVTVGQDHQNIFCRITNDDPTAVDSDTVKLHVKMWVGWWKLDDGAGDTAVDSSPEYFRTTATANDGTVVINSDPDGIWTAGGKIDGAIELDGSDDYVEIGKTASELGIGGNGPKSFAVWVYPKGFNNGGIYDLGNYQGGQDFSLRTIGGAGNTERWRIQYWGGDRDFWTWRNDGNKNVDTNFVFPSANAWVHFVHTHDGANTKIYANGVLIIDWAKGELSTADNTTLKIGSYHNRNGLNGDELIGIIDDVRAFNFALSLEEVIDIYADGEPGAKFCQGSNPADTDGDCDVDIDDLADTASNYLNTGIVP